MTETDDGLPISAGSALLLDQAIESYLASRADTPRLLKRAMGADPQDLMARCMMGYLTRLAGDPANAAASRALHADLRTRVDGGAGTDWERAHVAALGLWLADDLDPLMAHFEAIVERYPLDVLSLRMLHYLYFYDGDIERMRDSVATRLPRYRSHRLEGYVAGMYAFGLEESGEYAAAEHYGRAAVERNPADLWAGHAVAHVMEMQGRAVDGIAWLEALRPHCQAANNFRWHLDWHQALFHLRLGEVDRALAIFDGTLAAALADDFYLDLCNAAELLTRLEAAGCDVGTRWQPLVEIALRHVADTELLFASLHYLMPLARQRLPAADSLIDTLRAWSVTGTHQARIVRGVGLELAAMLVSLARGDRVTAHRHLERALPDLHRIGGSRAQREVFRIAAGSPAA